MLCVRICGGELEGACGRCGTSDGPEAGSSTGVKQPSWQRRRAGGSVSLQLEWLGGTAATAVASSGRTVIGTANSALR